MSRRAAQHPTATTRVHVPVIAAAVRRTGELAAETGESVLVTDVISTAAARGLSSVTAADVRRYRHEAGR